MKYIAEFVKRKIEQNKVSKQLHSMTDRELRDIGLTRFDIKRIVKET